MLFDYRTDTWNHYLSSLHTEDGSAWRTAKILRNDKPVSQPLQGQTGLVYSAAEKAEVFADTMEEQFKPHANIYDENHIEHVRATLDDYFVADPADDLLPVTLEEVQAVVKRSKPKKSPGLDGVKTRALLAAPPILLTCLVAVFNSALRLRHFPECWKAAKVILIPKPGKSKLLPQNFRPISLLSTISKIFERLFLSRLSPYLEGFIRPEQFGFRRGHSTSLQLTRVVNKLVDSVNLNFCSVAVLLDVSKAFDKVWHDGLLYKLAESPVPPAAVHLLRSYLRGRTFRTAVDGQLSSSRPIAAGVPQGSVLGPVLYLVYTNDIPVVAGVTLSLYADDAMFMCRGTRPTRAATAMQLQMDALDPWLKKWRIAINTDKSNAVCFRKGNRRTRGPLSSISLNGRPIEWKPNVKYLGVTLDAGLNFGAHATRKVNEARRVAGYLAPLIGRRSTLSISVKTRIFIMIIRSVLMYASTAWWALCSRTNKKKIEAVQNKQLRQITRQPWFVRNTTIRNALQVPTLEIFARDTAARLLSNAASSGLRHIEEIARRDGPMERNRPRPAAILDQPP